MKVRADKFGKYIFLLYVFLVLSLPDGIKNMTCLYKMSTRGLPILYTYNYYFSFLEIPIILVGLYVYRASIIIRFGKIIVVVALLNIIYAVIGMEMNIVSINSYELFLLLLTGFSTASIVMWVADDLHELEKILDWFILLQFLLQIVSAISGASGADGRYAAIGMGSGATASLAAAYLLWALFCRTSKTWWPPIVYSILSIILSGSRANFLAFIFIAVVFSGRLIRRQIRQGNKRNVQLIILIGLAVLALAIYFGYQRGMSELLARFTNLFQGSFVSNVQEDASYLGRLRSFQGSMRILQRHPFGIPFSIYAIEYYSAYTFSMEYPHSTLLSYILLWSPVVAAFCVFYLVRLMTRCFKRKLDDGIYLLYYLAMIIFYGSPVLYSKAYAFTLIIISYIVVKMRFADNGEQYD
ncbi:O-Antigen ligase [Butyrivibrio sp. YAB3001]|nr:O-Antigen ligase [Butyrivibrio sp. YAB3001]